MCVFSSSAIAERRPLEFSPSKTSILNRFYVVKIASTRFCCRKESTKDQYYLFWCQLNFQTKMFRAPFHSASPKPPFPYSILSLLSIGTSLYFSYHLRVTRVTTWRALARVWSAAQPTIWRPRSCSYCIPRLKNFCSACIASVGSRASTLREASVI